MMPMIDAVKILSRDSLAAYTTAQRSRALAAIARAAYAGAQAALAAVNGAGIILPEADAFLSDLNGRAAELDRQAGLDEQAYMRMPAAAGGSRPLSDYDPRGEAL